MSFSCPLCARGSRTRVPGPHARLHSLNHFQGGLFGVLPESLAISEQQRLMGVLRRLIETTQDRYLTMPLAGEVNVIKDILRQARAEGGLDFVLGVICALEGPIEV